MAETVANKKRAAIAVAHSHSHSLREGAKRARVGYRTVQRWLHNQDADFMRLLEEETALAAHRAALLADKWADKAQSLDLDTLQLNPVQVMTGYGISVDKLNMTTKRLQELRQGFNPDIIMQFTNVNVPPPVRGEVVEGEHPKALPEGALELVEPNEVEKVGK